MPDSRIQKWQRWLDEEIKPEVLALHWHRVIYREVGEVTRANATLPPNRFFKFVSETYAQNQAIAVRRQVESNARVVSLGSLLQEMASDPTRLTRRFYVSLYTEHVVDLADADFDRLAGAAGASHIPARIMREQLEAIRQAAEPIGRFVDQHIAHRDRARLSSLPTFQDLNRAIDAIGEAFRVCSSILTASSWATLEPVPQYDTLAIFRVPWIREDEGAAQL